jgi:hypothetical protein
MVKRISDDGKSAWHEPPFTKEEEEDLYRVRLPDTNRRSDISLLHTDRMDWRR